MTEWSVVKCDLCEYEEDTARYADPKKVKKVSIRVSGGDEWDWHICDSCFEEHRPSRLKKLLKVWLKEHIN